MTQLAQRDYFTDRSLLVDPYSYFAAHRAIAPIHKMEGRDVLIVTGFDEAASILKDTVNFSSAMTTAGPLVPMPFTPEGSDISAQIEAHRTEFPAHDMLTSMDGTQHHNTRAILNKLFVPARLKANEEYMENLANEMAAKVVGQGGCDIIKDIATPFVTYVISDLLGVPAADRDMFSEAIASQPPPFSLDDPAGEQAGGGFMAMGAYYYGYLEDRRANPRDDIITELTTAKYADGSTPGSAELVKLAMFVFGAGQDTSAKLLGNAVRHLCEDKALQQELREDPGKMTAFLEEMLRLEGSSKITTRLCQRDTTVGGTFIKAGTPVLIALGGANHDGARWEDPDAFRMKRPKFMEHLAFSRGAHACMGAPLARTEVRVFLNAFLRHTSDISIDEAVHGPIGARNLEYEASYVVRGLESMMVKLVPA